MIAGREEVLLDQRTTDEDDARGGCGQLSEVLLQRDRMRGRCYVDGCGNDYRCTGIQCHGFPAWAKRFPVAGGEIRLMEAIEVVSPWNLPDTGDGGADRRG